MIKRLPLEDGSSHPGLGGRLKALFRRIRNGASANFEEEVQDLIDHGAEKGVITPGEGEMIQSIFELGETLAREIMIPRTSVVAAPLSAPIGKVLELSVTSGHSRLPIYENDIDRIVGVLHVKDLLPHWGVSSEEPLPADIVRQVIFVPESKKIPDLLTELRTQKSHMAIVLDEYGGTAGLVTMEDIIEEIIGDIHDEYDVEEESITRIDQQTILVDGWVDIEELEDYLDIKLPEGEYETVGGLITDLMGRVPAEKETIKVENLIMTIMSADERKINQIEIKLPAPPEDRLLESA